MLYESEHIIGAMHMELSKSIKRVNLPVDKQEIYFISVYLTLVQVK